MINKILKLFRKDEKYGQVYYEEEGVPLFCGKWRLQNRSFYRIIKKDIRNIYKVYKYTNWNECLTKNFINKNILTQNNTPVIFKKKLKIDKKYFEFTKNGFKYGQIYEFTGMGFLNNSNTIKEVYLVLDQLVMFKDAYGNINSYTYNEIEQIRNEDSIKIIK